MGPEGFVIPAPAISQCLGLGHSCEQLGIQELIYEPAVERLGKTVLPRCSWHLVRRFGAGVCAQSLRAWAINSGPLLLRMNAGGG